MLAAVREMDDDAGAGRHLNCEARRIATESFACRFNERFLTHPGAKKEFAAISAGHLEKSCRLFAREKMARDAIHIVVVLRSFEIDSDFAIGDRAQHDIV